MLGEATIRELFEALNRELAARDARAEVGIVGGAVMCLVYKARAATRDVDAIFEPAALVRELVARIGEERRLPKDWLNDAAKGFVQGNFAKQEVLQLSHLLVWAPESRYMLAMKCISARWDTSDRDDVIFLIRHLGLDSAKSVFDLIEHYYPRRRIPPKTQFFIEEVFEAGGGKAV